MLSGFHIMIKTDKYFMFHVKYSINNFFEVAGIGKDHNTNKNNIKILCV